MTEIRSFKALDGFNDPDIGVIDGELCYTPRGTLRLVAHTAYKVFDRQARANCARVLKLCLSVAKERGYCNERAFKAHFTTTAVNPELERRLAGEVLDYISAEELMGFITGV